MLFCFRYKLITLVLLIVGLITTPSEAQFFNINGHSARVNVPFRIVRNMIVVQASINGQGPFNFILDTGVGYMVITDPDVVSTVHIVKSRTIMMSGMGDGEDLEAYVTNPLQVDISGLRSQNVCAAIFKKDHFGLSNYAGIPICGLLGYEFFNNLVVRVDFADSTLTAYNPQKFRAKKSYAGVPISIEGNKPYLMSQVKFKDSTQKDCKLIVDLGAGHPLSLETIDNRLLCPKKSIAANLGMGLNGPVCGRISRVSELGLGKFVLKDVLTSFPDRSKKQVISSRDGSIGIDVLKRFKLIIDYPHGMIYLKPRFDFKEPFEHDMSGMEYYCDGEDYKRVIISRVEPGSAADKIGLEKDDELLQINLKPVKKMSLDDIDALFRSREGRTLLLEVYRDNQYTNVIITLAKRI